MGKVGVIVIEGHVQGLANTRILGREGLPVIVVDRGDCVARYSRYCTKYFKSPDYLSDEFVEFLEGLHKRENLQGWVLLPSNDHAVYTIAKNRERLAKRFSLITESLETIEKIYNKRTLLTIAEKLSIPIPATLMPTEGNPESVTLRYPLIIKGNNGLSFYKKFRRKAIVVENEKELKSLWETTLKGADPNEYFIQEMLPYDHKTVSVTIFAVDGVVHTHWSGVKLREHPIRFGTATCCQSIHDNEMLQESKKLIRELKYTGVCEVEWLRDSRDNLPKLIEINARTWLWVGLAEKCGISYPKIIYDYLAKGALPQRVDYKDKVIWLNLYTDLIYSIKRVVTKVDSCRSILFTYKKFNEACWDKRDPKPFFAYGLLGFKFLKNR